MKITHKWSGDLTGIKFAYNYDDSSRFVTPQVELVADADEAEKLFGGDFCSLYFDAIIESENPDGVKSYKASYKAITPDIACENHVLIIEGEELTAQPKLHLIKPVKDKREILIVMRFLLPFSKKLAGRLGDKFGEAVAVSLCPVQAGLPLKNPGVSTTKRGRHGNAVPVKLAAVAPAKIPGAVGDLSSEASAR